MPHGASRRSIITGLAGLATATLAMPHVARAAVRTLRCGHNNTEASHYGQGSTAFAKAVAADPVLAGVVKVDVHGNAEFGDELSTLRNVVNGTLDAVLCSGSVLGNLSPESGLLDALFLFRDVERARAALDGPLGAEYAELLGSKGINVLAWAENGLRHVTSDRPIRTPADLKGLRIRVPQSEVMMQGFKALGADAAPLSFNQVREALRTGQFEAQENPIVIIESVRLNELQKCVSLTGHSYDPAVFVASPDVIEDLTEAQRTALVACARKGAAVTRTVAASAQTEGLSRLKAAGMVVVTDVDVAAFRAAAQPFLQGLAAKYGADRMQRLLSAGA